MSRNSFLLIFSSSVSRGRPRPRFSTWRREGRKGGWEGGREGRREEEEGKEEREGMHKEVIHTEVRLVTSEKSIFLIVVSGYILWHENSSPQACGQDKHSNCSNTITVD